jgi:hypothetical protein
VAALGSTACGGGAAAQRRSRPCCAHCGAALAIFLMLNAVTPFITPDPPWLANLPLVIAIMAFLLAFGLSHLRAERTRGRLPQ